MPRSQLRCNRLDSFYPDHDGQVGIRTNGFPNVIALYRYGPSSFVPTRLRCEPGSTFSSNELYAHVTRGTYYTFQVGGRGGASGPLHVGFNFAYRTHLTVSPFETLARVLPTAPGSLRARLFWLRFIGVVPGEHLSAACAFCEGGALGSGSELGNTTRLSAGKTKVIIDPKSRL